MKKTTQISLIENNEIISEVMVAGRYIALDGEGLMCHNKIYFKQWLTLVIEKSMYVANWISELVGNYCCILKA